MVSKKQTEKKLQNIIVLTVLKVLFQLTTKKNEKRYKTVPNGAKICQNYYSEIIKLKKQWKIVPNSAKICQNYYSEIINLKKQWKKVTNSAKRDKIYKNFASPLL